MIKIDIGAGSPDQAKKGYKSLDVNPDYKPEYLCDVNKGLPFKDNTVEAVWMDNSLEHLWNHVFVLQEVYRVLEVGGVVEFKMPNCQYFPVLVAGWFGDIQRMWNWYMNLPFKKGRSIHYTLWTKECLIILLKEIGRKSNKSSED